ncbi:hypothetical protein BT63DRAFT_158370 [Microthyrium microscopicum]|uniref:HAUS augmin-like complex subunit 6 N-terminal domain-containing protein n=1 Tax=Microthyrium microscopicum TaxID=703497 RepID=A0A6A6UPW7_9PEZI|nr:hypothetical protein BT63DRAFT_158370 [Microthyrium microscopicum]
MAAPTFRPSLAELFLSNLRLLDLDRRNDWPNISSGSFCSKDVQGQDQKARIRCAEWSLYRLFELWDANETRDKLQPFFPPLEPLQSLNLRSALYRLLNDVKKNGLLGRETVLRKTMLDDCRGDKFLEVLVVFSTAVVKKVAVPRITKDKSRKPVALGLATATMLEAVDQGSLLPLAVAHRSSLALLLHKKAEAKLRCQDFSDLLDQKNNQLMLRNRECNLAERPATDAAEASKVEKEVRDNWLGNSKWPRALLYGDETNAGDQPLKRPFADVWGVVVGGGTLQPDLESVGLIESLERRVNEQQARLSKWRAFHKDMAHSSQSASSVAPGLTHAAKLRTAFEFQKHTGLHLKANQPKTQPLEKSYISNPELQAILADLKYELEEVSKPKAIPVAPLSNLVNVEEQKQQRDFRPTSEAMNNMRPPPQPISNRPLSGAFSYNGISSTAVPLSRIFSPSKSFRLNGRSASSSSSNMQSPPSSAGGAEISRVPDCAETMHEPTPPPTPKVVLPDDDIDDDSLVNGSVADRSEASTSYSGEDIAEIAAMRARSASPGNRMSLAERTRLSLFQANSISQSQVYLHPTESYSKEDTSIIAFGPSVADRRASLLERTQQSMAHLAANSRSRQSISVKKNRQSVAFPVNQFETPGKPRPAPMRDATPTEKLFSEDAEYASVFRSRPRIALSPVHSPDGELPDAPDEEITDDTEVDIDGDSWIRSSPLRGRG